MGGHLRQLSPKLLFTLTPDCNNTLIITWVGDMGLAPTRVTLSGQSLTQQKYRSGPLKGVGGGGAIAPPFGSEGIFFLLVTQRTAPLKFVGFFFLTEVHSMPQC